MPEGAIQCSWLREIPRDGVASQAIDRDQQGFAQKVIFGLNVPASPPDVRQGYALPSSLSFNSGYARGSG